MHNYLKLKQRKEKRSKKKKKKEPEEENEESDWRKIPGREKSEMERIILMCVLYGLGKRNNMFENVFLCIILNK